MLAFVFGASGSRAWVRQGFQCSGRKWIQKTPVDEWRVTQETEGSQWNVHYQTSYPCELWELNPAGMLRVFRLRIILTGGRELGYLYTKWQQALLMTTPKACCISPVEWGRGGPGHQRPPSGHCNLRMCYGQTVQQVIGGSPVGSAADSDAIWAGFRDSKPTAPHLYLCL